jgi:hypothetical protein
MSRYKIKMVTGSPLQKVSERAIAKDSIYYFTSDSSIRII